MVQPNIPTSVCFASLFFSFRSKSIFLLVFLEMIFRRMKFNEKENERGSRNNRNGSLRLPTLGPIKRRQSSSAALAIRRSFQFVKNGMLSRRFGGTRVWEVFKKAKKARLPLSLFYLLGRSSRSRAYNQSLGKGADKHAIFHPFTMGRPMAGRPRRPWPLRRAFVFSFTIMFRLPRLFLFFTSSFGRHEEEPRRSTASTGGASTPNIFPSISSNSFAFSCFLSCFLFLHSIYWWLFLGRKKDSHEIDTRMNHCER